MNFNELAGLVGLDHKTVEKYISLLEQSFVTFQLPAFSRSLRNELKRSRKIYFYDTGIRNAILNDFRALNLRQDEGALFEKTYNPARFEVVNSENYLEFLTKQGASGGMECV